jgi:hypothetical protein
MRHGRDSTVGSRGVRDRGSAFRRNDMYTNHRRSALKGSEVRADPELSGRMARCRQSAVRHEADAQVRSGRRSRYCTLFAVWPRRRRQMCHPRETAPSLAPSTLDFHEAPRCAPVDARCTRHCVLGVHARRDERGSFVAGDAGDGARAPGTRRRRGRKVHAPDLWLYRRRPPDNRLHGRHGFVRSRRARLAGSHR